MISIPSPRGKRRARIEIIPLIDIVFFLLATFVMVSLSMVKNQGIAVNLPAASTGAPREHAESTTISIDAESHLFLDKQPIASDELESSLRRLLARDSDPRIFINGDAKAEFGKAITVLDTARRLGITKVAIQTEPAKAAPPAP